jgi:predicted transcriptional regulator
MTKPLKDAIAPVGDVFAVPEEHRAAALQGFEQAERGEFVDDEKMAALWKKCGL